MSKNSEATEQLLLDASTNHRIPEDFNLVSTRKRLKSKTKNQQIYMEMIDQAVITLCGGPAGTGKSFIAIGKAVEALLAGSVKKILISKPTVECGNKLGFLPGDASNKIEPYFRSVKDILVDFLTVKELKNYLENEVIEFCALAYMRGRTISDSFLILDEAQNAKENEIQMFMTRIGEGSRMLVVGDTTDAQCDLPKNEAGAFAEYIRKFGRRPYIDGIQVFNLQDCDIVRHHLIQKIIKRCAEE
jgi:phosphate starvation-inducible PhoH-like protein